MPRSRKHVQTGLIVGGILGAACSLIKQLTENSDEAGINVDWVIVSVWALIGAVVSAFFARLPDILEPAYTPNHRGFFHSYTVLGLLAVTVFKIDERARLNFVRKSLIYCAIVGYGSHLVLDSKTPAGLDLV